MPPVEGAGEKCPKCGEGTLAAKRGRFGVFAGCDRYPDCDYIHRTGPPPPPPLPFEVECPKCGEGRLTARRARRTGNVFYGCGRYPKCDFTTNFEPVGALHDADDGPVGLKDESGICLRCGAPVDLPGDRAAAAGSQAARRRARCGRPRAFTQAQGGQQGPQVGQQQETQDHQDHGRG